MAPAAPPAALWEVAWSTLSDGDFAGSAPSAAASRSSHGVASSSAPPAQVAVPPIDAIEILDWATDNSSDLRELRPSYFR